MNKNWRKFPKYNVKKNPRKLNVRKRNDECIDMPCPSFSHDNI